MKYMNISTAFLIVQLEFELNSMKNIPGSIVYAGNQLKRNQSNVTNLSNEKIGGKIQIERFKFLTLERINFAVVVGVSEGNANANVGPLETFDNFN